MPKNIRVETARKNNKYSRNETLLKVADLAKAIAHAKARATLPFTIT